MTEQASIISDLPIKALSEALQRYYQGNQGIHGQKSNVVNPFQKIANYVYKAWKAGLDKKEECAYAGSMLIFAVQKEMGVRYASNVDNVNQLYLAGMRMANALWTRLDNLKNNVSKVDDQTFENMLRQASDEFWDRYRFEYGVITDQVVTK